MKNLKIRQLDYEKLMLRFTPYASHKLVYANELSCTEFSAFGISNAKNLLLVEDIVILKQADSGAYTIFDDEAVADHFDKQVDAGRKPHQFARIWIHTHPNGFGRKLGGKRNKRDKRFWEDDDMVSSPSNTDDATFKRAFGECDWAVMCIYSGGSNAYARLALRNKQFRGETIIPARLQTNNRKPTPDDYAAWRQEYEQNVTVKTYNRTNKFNFDDDDYLPVQRTLLLTCGDFQTIVLPIDVDIDLEEFTAFLDSYSITPQAFCRYGIPTRNWWFGEFRATRKKERVWYD